MNESSWKLMMVNIYIARCCRKIEKTKPAGVR